MDPMSHESENLAELRKNPDKEVLQFGTLGGGSVTRPSQHFVQKFNSNSASSSPNHHPPNMDQDLSSNGDAPSFGKMLPLDRSRTNTNMDRESKSISHLTDDRRRKTVSTAPRSVNLYADWSGHKTID